MGTIYIENQPYDVDSNENVLRVSLDLGFNLPYFCWHPAMGSVGACRQCAVKQFKDERDTRGRIVMACMTPAAEGTRVSIHDAEAAEFRAGVIEGLMMNHPHDCPICDEGGECHLQDVTVMTGHNYRRYRGLKRTFRDQYLGPFLEHEMNRCIQCYRCVRFYRDYAGGRDFDCFSIHDTVYFGRHKDGVLESEFAGNLAEVCPTGVFVDRTLSMHYTRKWDTQWAPSICHSCAVGCNISCGERYSMVRRIVNRVHHDLNGYFLCDRGRYSYEFVNSDERVRRPLVRRDGALAEWSGSEAVGRLAETLAGGKAIGIGSPRASLEANFALRTAVGADSFYSGISRRESDLLQFALGLSRDAGKAPSISEMQSCDAVLVLGEDISNTAARIALAVRQAAKTEPARGAEKLKLPPWNDYAVRQVIQNRHGPLFIATIAPTRLDDIATATFRRPPAAIAALGHAVAGEIRGKALGDLPDDTRSLAAAIADALRAAESPLIVTGISLASEDILTAASDVAASLRENGRKPRLAVVLPEANSAGLTLMQAPALSDCLDALRQSGPRPVIVLENDIARRLPSAEAGEWFRLARPLVVLDSIATRTVKEADLVLPAGTFTESDGTVVNYEGRAQRFFQVYPPGDEITESWRWLRDGMIQSGRYDSNTWRGLDDVVTALIAGMPQFAGIENAAPGASFRGFGSRIPRQPHRYSGRTAMFANVTVHEPPPAPDTDSPLGFTMEGLVQIAPAAATPFYWDPGWNADRTLTRFREEIAPKDIPKYPPVFLGAPREIRPPQREDPAQFETGPGEWLLLPLYHIFGSEEMTHWAPAIRSLAPEPYVALNETAGFEHGRELNITVGAAVYRLPVRIIHGLADGVAGIPFGLPGMEAFRLPAKGRITSVL
jgi:NADH-quinone oxidoreductase subunit G